MKPPISPRVDSVPLLDVARSNGPLREQFLQALTDVLDSGRFVFGPWCEQLEEAVAELCGTAHAVGCASGSDALILALLAADVGPGDDVLVPSFTFFATVSAVTRLGARPVLVDIDPHTFNIDPQELARAATPETKAVIPVHLFGQCADMDPILQLAAQRGWFVIEDAAQAIGAGYRSQFAGSLGHVGCFSFYPTKNLGGMGDGGMLTTDDAEIAERLRRLRNHGMHPRYHHKEVGLNSRLDSFQAAVLGVKLPHLAAWTHARRENAARYTELFEQADLGEGFVIPREEQGSLHVWNQFTVRVTGGRRDELKQHLASRGVGSEIYYPVPAHRQQCFRGASVHLAGRLPHTEAAAAEVLSLPICPERTEAEIETVVARVSEFFAAGHSAKAA